jgi:hypothetical protein
MPEFIITCYWSYQIKEDEMGLSYNTHEGYQMQKGIEYDNLKRIDHLRNTSTDGKLALEWMLSTHTTYTVRIQLAQDRVK